MQKWELGERNWAMGRCKVEQCPFKFEITFMPYIPILEAATPAAG